MKWQNALGCQVLYQEVMDQIEVVDNYKSSRRTKFVEIMSFAVFPMLLILQMLSSGLIKTKTIGPADEFNWLVTLTIIILVSLGFVVGYCLLNLWNKKK